MSKISMPRPRYVAVELTAAKPLSRKAFGNALKGRARHDGWSDAEAPALTRFAWPHAIVRVEHIHAARARGLLEAITWATEGEARIDVKVRTLSTSGTLAALTERLGVLQKRDA